MPDIQRIINEHLDTYFTEYEDADLIEQFEQWYSDLDETSKSNLVRILIGYGAATKTKDGKLKFNKRKANSVTKKLGIKRK